MMNSMVQDEEGNLAGILIAYSDPRTLNELEGQILNVIGPDNCKQSCTKTTNTA